jgi:hypothetical protein
MADTEYSDPRGGILQRRCPVIATALDAALRYVQLGLGPFPVPPPDAHHDGKVPDLPWKPYQRDERIVEAHVREWFTGREQNIALLTGALYGVVVVDADSVEALRWCVLRLPRTPWQVRTAKGWHLYYRTADVPVRNRARIDTGEGRFALDVRGDGGYVIAPPSLHRSGTRYALAGDWTQPIEALPRFWPGWLEKPKRRERDGTVTLPRPTGDVTERARRYLAAIPRPEIGQGSDNAVLYAACKLLRGFALDAGTTEALLWEWAGGRPGWTQTWIAGKVRSAARYGTEPIGALR